MSIELQVKMLYENADKLDEAGFVADFYYIAKEYARQQLLQQTPCTTHVCLHEWVSSVAYKGAKVCTKCHAYQ